MTDPQPAPTPMIDHAALEQQWREQERRADEVRQANKAVLFDALTNAGIDTVIVMFDGYGDSGQIESIEAKAGLETVILPSAKIELAKTAWQNAVVERVTLSVHNAIETLAFDILRQLHSGWEINDGAYGEFTFDVAELTITLDYNERYTSSEHTSHTF